MGILDWLSGKKKKKDGTGAVAAAQEPAPSAPDRSKRPASVGGDHPSPFDEFAQRASQSPASITIKMSDYSRLVDAVRDALMKAHPHLESAEAFSHASLGSTLRCPNCGRLSDEIGPVLYLAGSRAYGSFKSVAFGGPNVASVAQGRCPGCGGNQVVFTFTPQKIKEQLDAAEAEVAAAQGISQLAAVCAGGPFLRSLDVSPDESLVCCVGPDGIVAYESGTHRLEWSLTVPSVESCFCRFVSPERLLVLSEKNEDRTLIQLVNTADGSVIAEELGPQISYSDCDCEPRTGLFVGHSYNEILTILTAGDKLELSTWKCGQIFRPGPKIGPDGKCYLVDLSTLSRIDGKQSTRITSGSNCICFQAPARVYCGGGYSDRSGESALHIGDLESGITSEIPWGNEPIDEIAHVSSDRLLISNTVCAVQMGRYPNAVVTLLSIASRTKEWSLTIGDLKPWRSVILVCAPEEGWALIQTGKSLKLIALQDGKTIRILPKQYQEIVTAKWLASKKLLYVARNPDEKKPGTLECYRI